LCLTRLGVRVRIIDKAAEAGTTSRALGVHARTLEFYRQLGFADEVVQSGIKAPAANLWVRGSRAARIPIAKMGEGQTAFPYILMYPQDEHERLLIRKLAAAGVEVERSIELVDFNQDGAGMRVGLKLANGTKEEVECAFLAGCDGASSIVRQTLKMPFPGGTYSHIFYVADVEATGPAADKEVHIDLEDADFLAVFPMTRPGHVRVIGSVPDDLAGQREKLRLGDVRGKALQNLKLEVTKENWFSSYRVHHRVVDHFRQGRAFLLGDAAHLHSPLGAQGMNTGIGDAVNLSWKLAAVLKGGAPDSLLDTFEFERIAFARRLVSTTDKAFTFATNRGAVTAFLRRTLLPILLPRLVAVSAFGNFVFKTLSQIGIRYRHSSLSSGSAGGVHGGDRLPWYGQSDGGDNFAALKGLAWSVHVYGILSPGVKQCCETLKLPLQHFDWDHGMGSVGLVQGALYLVRPDGYIAMVDAEARPSKLSEYCVSRNLLEAVQADTPRTP
jgi:2-polyprenyl-6-methoxyphenol hydroxylase-like FAD-dependent oxidoreductase